MGKNNFMLICAAADLADFCELYFPNLGLEPKVSQGACNTFSDKTIHRSLWLIRVSKSMSSTKASLLRFIKQKI